jgi:hypothetical protein
MRCFINAHQEACEQCRLRQARCTFNEPPVAKKSQRPQRSDSESESTYPDLELNAEPGDSSSAAVSSDSSRNTLSQPLATPLQ